MRFWAFNVRHGLSSNQIARYFKLKKLKNYTRFHIDFLHVVRWLLKLQNYHAILAYGHNILLATQFAGFSTFDLFDLLILNLLSIATLHLLG